MFDGTTASAFASTCDEMLGGVRDGRRFKDWHLLISLQSTKALACLHDAGGGPARSAMAGLRQRFTLRQTRRTVPSIF